MKQYIKKALWIIPFVFSLNLNAQVYYFVGTGTAASPGDAETLTNWNTSPLGTGSSLSTLADFYAGGFLFDLNSKVVDFAGIYVGGVTNSGTTYYCEITNGTIYNSGDFTILNNKVKFTTVNLNFNSSAGNTVWYGGDGSTPTIPVFAATYQNLAFYADDIEFQGGQTIINNKLETYDLIYIYTSTTTQLTFGSSMTINLFAGTKFYINIRQGAGALISSYYLFTDNRSTRTYPGYWEFKNNCITSSNNREQSIHPGTYDTLKINGPFLSFNLRGNTVIDKYFDISSDVSGTTVTSGRPPTTTTSYDTSATRFYLNGYTLTCNGRVNQGYGTSLKIKFVGDNSSSLVVGGNSTIYFDQLRNIYRTLKNFSVTGNNSVVTLGNHILITGGTTNSSDYGVVDVTAASAKLYTKGKLTLKSNQYGTAMISASPGTIAFDSLSNIGTLLVENYIPYLNRGRQYRFLSAPVSGGVFLQWRDSLNNRSGRGIHITGDKTKSKETTGTPTPIDSFDMSTTNFPSAFYYDETKAGSITGIGTNSGAAEDAGWIRLPQANTNTIENGKGYRILVRGDRTRWIVSGGNSTDYDANNTTIQTRGGYVAGPVNVPIKNSGSNTNNGINLVGNPYACAIDWQQVYYACSTTVDPTYVLYDPVGKSWQSYNANSATPSSYQYISPGQGFLVYTTSTSSTNVVFPIAAKTTAQAGVRVFTEIKTNHLVTHLRKDTTAADMNIIYFLKGATNYYDKYDAGHIQNDNVNLSSLDSTNTLYNINCLDSLTGSRIVPMSVYGTPKGSYTMTFSDVNTFNNHDIFLVDNFLNKTTKVDDMTQYQIDITDDKFSYAEGRLFISFEPKAASSVVSINKTENFKVSPNPVKDQLSVTMQKPVIGDIEYDIVNIQGQLISKGIISSGSNKIQTSQLSTGIYFINLRAENQTQSIKFIK